MSPNPRRRRTILAAVLAAVLAGTGCAAVKPPAGEAGPVTANRLARKQAVVSDFEKRRDAAQFEAALAAYQQGDLAGCRQGLEAILGRTPNTSTPGGSWPTCWWWIKARPKRRRSGGRVMPTSGEESDGAKHVDRIEVEQAPAGSDGGSPADFVKAAVAAVASGADPEAVAWTRQAEALRPQDPQIPVTVAVEALRSNRAELAVAVLEPAATRFTESAAIQRVLGAAYYRKGDYLSAQGRSSRRFAWTSPADWPFFDGMHRDETRGPAGGGTVLPPGPPARPEVLDRPLA